MPIHVAILKRPYLELILSGAKTVESRLTKSAVPPYRAIEPGHRIFLKESGGRFRATAIAGQVCFFADLSPARVEQLRIEYQARVGGDADYWHAKRDSRFGTFIELRQVQAADSGPAYPVSPYRAWFTLLEQGPATMNVPLTSGGIRNRYVSIAAWQDCFPPGPFTLELPDGAQIETTLFRRQRIRWRGWGAYFERYRLQAGDSVCFTAIAPQAYRISFHAQSR